MLRYRPIWFHTAIINDSALFITVWISVQTADQFRSRVDDVHLHIWNRSARHLLPEWHRRLRHHHQTLRTTVAVPLRIQRIDRIYRYLTVKLSVFTARRYVPSSCHSCVSVTLRYRIKPAKHRTMQTTPCDSPRTRLLILKILAKFEWGRFQQGAKCRCCMLKSTLICAHISSELSRKRWKLILSLYDSNKRRFSFSFGRTWRWFTCKQRWLLLLYVCILQALVTSRNICAALRRRTWSTIGLKRFHWMRPSSGLDRRCWWRS